MTLNLRSLIGRLDTTSRRALESALGLAVSRTHYEVTPEHWLAALIDTSDGDVPRILAHFGLDPGRVVASLQQSLDRFRTGNGDRPELSPYLEELTRDAWVLASINYAQERVRSGVLLLASLQHAVLGRRWCDLHPSLQRIQPQVLERDLLTIVSGSAEDRECAASVAPAARSVPAGSAAASATPALDQYTVDLTADATDGRLDPVVGRDAEIRQIIDILTRKRQNNPILTGEAGVGKTAVVEGFAQRVATGDVPERLRSVRVRRLDLGLLQAGAGVKGEFENRLKQVIEEVQGAAQPIVLFIDEAHTLIGAGGAAGQQDAANLLKPALARGELRTIAATTWAEYKRYFEKDPALSRRFQVVKIDEPDEPAAIAMMRGVARHLEAHHGVEILDEAVIACVHLSARYIAARQLPDKSTSVLDTACARVALGRSALPGPIEDLRRRGESLVREAARLEREQHLGADHAERLAALARAQAEATAELTELERRWAEELRLADAIDQLRARLVAGVSRPAPGDEVAAGAEQRPGAREPSADERDEAEPRTVDRESAIAAQPSNDGDATPERLRLEYAALVETLRKLQGERPLVAIEVDAQAVAEVISSWTGIPVGRMLADEIRSVLGLAEQLGRRVIGQDAALETIARRIHTARAGLDHPGRPQGVFLLVGPSGVGKTETALALSEALYGGERNLITINLSEYQESHTVSGLRGSPPGYVGYGEGGVLTEAVRRRPHAVVLLDEAEKAHPDVMELFYQVFDKGVLEDGEGREIDFKNTLILLCSNVASDRLHTLCADPDLRPAPDALERAIRGDLLNAFPAALLGRLVVVPYYPLAREVLERIVQLQLDRIAARLADRHAAELECDPSVIAAILERAADPGSGARAIDRILTHQLLPRISAEMLGRLAESRRIARIRLHVGADAEWRFEFEEA